MPGRFSRMAWPERLAWAAREHLLRRRKFEPVAERRREQEIGATSVEANRAVRRYLRIEAKQSTMEDKT